MDSAQVAQLALIGRLAPRNLDDCGVRQHLLNRLVLAVGALLSPDHQRVSGCPLVSAEGVDFWQLGEDQINVALVGRLFQWKALLASPVKSPALIEALLENRRHLAQMENITARISLLLLAQWAGVPVRKAGALVELHLEQVTEQGLVADLRSQAGKGSRDLGVEAIARMGVPESPQQRDVLAASVDNDLDLWVVDQFDDWRWVDLAIEWIDQFSPSWLAILLCIDGYLD